MKRLAAVLGVLLPAAVSGQRSAEPALVPDSSYMTLTLDLPIHGTFHLVQVEAFGSGARRRTILHSLRNVEVQQCIMSWRYGSRVYEDSRSSWPAGFEARVPLKSIDPKTLVPRVAFAPARSRYETQVYEIMGYALDRRARPITVRNLDTGTKRNERNFVIRIGEETAARRIASALADAAQRCDSWRTGPMPVIRQP